MPGGGTGAEVMRRIAVLMVCRMVSATVLTLLVIAAVLLIWKRRSLESVAAPDQRNATAT